MARYRRPRRSRTANNESATRRWATNDQRPSSPAVSRHRHRQRATGDGRRAPIMMITVYGRDVRADVTPRPNLEVLPARPVVRPAERPRNRCGETFTGSPRWRRLETPAHEADKASGSPRRFLDHRTPGQARRCRLPVTIPGPAGTGTGRPGARTLRSGTGPAHRSTNRAGADRPTRRPPMVEPRRHSSPRTARTDQRLTSN